MTTIQEAYEAYLRVFPLYWEGCQVVPKTQREFLVMYEMAIGFKSMYEQELRKGILNPMSLYTALNMDQFLGIPHTQKELCSAFHFAFDKVH